jgi:hypothetical protein
MGVEAVLQRSKPLSTGVEAVLQGCKPLFTGVESTLQSKISNQIFFIYPHKLTLI